MTKEEAENIIENNNELYIGMEETLDLFDSNYYEKLSQEDDRQINDMIEDILTPKRRKIKSNVYYVTT